MKSLRSLLIISAAVALAAGCKTKHSSPPGAKDATAATNAPPVASAHQVTPGSEIRGEISRVNAAARFVVLGFPVGVMPSKGSVLGVFRQGVKVGEIMVSGPQRDTFTVADILKGECRVGDETHP
ncbi:MAG: hypothetical protein HYR88_17545 [Verrucomicrobia bacterium]|nr:hypothetical protein [Verrucomicrobiota bacterium]MBI3870931.1 hypothetical protein [Verrucomicrobiota bacterium]